MNYEYIKEKIKKERKINETSAFRRIPPNT